MTVTVRSRKCCTKVGIEEVVRWGGKGWRSVSGLTRGVTITFGRYVKTCQFGKDGDPCRVSTWVGKRQPGLR